MSYKGNEYSFQIGAEINADVKALEKELKGLVGKMNANAEGTFTLNIDEAKQSLDTLLETVSKIKSNFDTGVKVNIDTQSAEEDIRQLYAKLEDVAKNKSGSDGFIIKDAVKLQSILERVSSSLEKMKKTKLGEALQTKDLQTGELKTVLDENGKAMTLYDKIVSNADSNLAKVEQAVKDLSQALREGKMPIEEYREAMNDLNKLSLALAEGDEAFNLNNVGNAKNNTADKSDQTMLYKELATLKREENALTERSIKLSKEKNQAEISAVNEQLQAIQKRKAEINSEIIDRNLVGKFFEKDLLNIDEKGRTNLIDKTAKEFDSLNSMLDTQNAKISEAQANIEKYLVSFKNLTPEARAELESLKQLLESQKEDNIQAKSSAMENNIASKDSELAQLAHKLNIESLQTKNTSLEVSKELLAMSSEMIRSMQLANKIEGETLAVQQKKAQLITMINGLQTEAQRYQTSFINEEDKTKAMAISEQIQKIKEEMSSINTENLTGEELVTAQKRFEENIRTVRNLSNELSNLNKNNVKIKAEIDFDGATRDAENKTKELGNKLSKEINQLGAFKLTNAYGNEAEIDSVIAQLRQLETEKKNLESQPITNKAELIEYQKNLTELNNKYKELKLSASSINIDASISKSFDKMTSDANSVVMKTREMEEAMHKASQQYKHIDTKQMQSLHTMLMQVRAEAEKVAKTKFDDFNAHTSTIALKNMNTQLKELGLGFTQVKNEAQSWDRAMGQFFDVRKVMAFTSQFTFLRQAISMVTREVQALDSAMTTLRITIDGTESQYKDMTSSVAQMAKESGTTFEKALSLLKTYANSTDSIESTMAKIKPTMMLSNITDFSGAEAVDAVQAILEQFKLYNAEADNMEEASYRVTDALISISKSLKMDFATGTKEIADGIKASGAVAEQAGIQMEWYASAIASTIESTRMAGSQGLGFLFIEI